jgi:SAM-dependent methyltransferase
MTAGQALESRWYMSLKEGAPDYSVYDDEFFVGDIWACWTVYSRKYLRMMKSSFNNMLGRNLTEDFLGVRSIVDLGCGIGYTTAALKELFPAAAVYGTQLQNTFQYKVATEIGLKRQFDVYPQVMSQTDVIFASEYFEHFQRPIEHLLKVIQICQPKHFIIANSFGARSIGHFDIYLDERRIHVDKVEQLCDISLTNIRIGRDFNAVLRNNGYTQLKTGFWNNRPAVWTRR